MFGINKLKRTIAEMDNRLRFAESNIKDLAKTEWGFNNPSIWNVGDVVEGHAISGKHVCERQGAHYWGYYVNTPSGWIAEADLCRMISSKKSKK